MNRSRVGRDGSVGCRMKWNGILGRIRHMERFQPSFHTALRVHFRWIAVRHCSVPVFEFVGCCHSRKEHSNQKSLDWRHARRWTDDGSACQCLPILNRQPRWRDCKYPCQVSMRFAVCLWLVHDVCLWFSEPADCQLAVLKHCVSEAIKFIHPAQET
jgi:hypothetical protein